MFFSNHLSCFILSQVDNLLKFQHLSNLLKCQHLRKASKCRERDSRMRRIVPLFKAFFPLKLKIFLAPFCFLIFFLILFFNFIFQFNWSLFRIFLLLNFILFLILFFIYLHFPGQPFTEPVINAGEFMIRLIFPIFIFPSLVCFFIYFLSFFLWKVELWKSPAFQVKLKIYFLSS